MKERGPDGADEESKPLLVRGLDHDLRSNMELLADLEGISLNEYVRRACVERVNSQLSDEQWKQLLEQLQALRT